MPPRDPRRVDRVAEAVREEVAAFLTRDAKDPRLTGFVTVTAVEMTRDLRHATIFVSVMGSESERTATFDGLKSVASHLRSRVGKALRLQFAPEIQFKLDESVAHAARIETLLAGLRDVPPADVPPADVPPADVPPDDRDG
jgi:ribosome-binding factor A